MNQQHQDVNFCLGSWGPQPNDHYKPARAVDPADLLTVNDWYDLAVRWGSLAIAEIRAGHPELAGEYARGAARFCLKHQQANGKPWDGGRSE